MSEEHKIYIVDAFCLLFRAFYAVPSLTRSDGMHVGALYGFLSSMSKIIAQNNPEKVCIALDSPGEGIRHALYPDYKKNRSEAPAEIIEQINELPRLLEDLGWVYVSVPGYEADDIIASYARFAQKQGYHTVIVSSDKDLAQLVNEHVSLYNPSTMIRKGEEEVYEKFGVKPESMQEYLMLVGDSSDNVPGVRGVGPKTAVKLLHAYGNIDGIYNNIDALSPGVQRAMKEFAGFRQTCYDLIRLRDDIPINVSLEDMRWRGVPQKSVDDVINRYEFFSLKAKMAHFLVHDTETRNACTIIEKEKDFISIVLQVGQIACFHSDEKYVLSARDGEIYVCEELSHAISSLFMKEEIKGLFWGIRQYVNNVEPGHHDDLQVLAYLAYGVIHASDMSGIPELSNCFGGCSEEFVYAVGGCVWKIAHMCLRNIHNKSLLSWYKDVELPLLNVLSEMEDHGMNVSSDVLKTIETTLVALNSKDEQDIYASAGKEFNIASSQQLATVIYDEKKLLPVKKGRSTDAKILESIKSDPFIHHVLSWRHRAKLLSTYVLPLQAKACNSVVHTHFTSTTTLSGRFASSDPNLQNIPIRTAEGRMIREAFFTKKGRVFLSFDYSQIELRLLVHYAGEGAMQEAFLANRDIHTATAALIFDVPESDISKEMRSKAKTINFGLIYGMGARALSQRLQVSRDEAQDLLDRCLGRYPEIQEYIKKMQRFVEYNGYVETVCGRACYLPAIMSDKAYDKAHALRQAINIPLQASNADIMKKAMLAIQEEIIVCGKAKMVLQVHDELLLDVCEDDVDVVARSVKKNNGRDYAIADSVAG